MSQWKNDKDVWLTAALFWDLQGLDSKENCIYTLKDEDFQTEDGRTMLSLRNRYLELNDPTEYQFATKYFGSFRHWKKVAESPRIAPHVEEWREELEVKLRSQGIKAMIEKAADGDYQPSKYLADKGWELKKRGAPSKAEKARELKVQANVADVVDMHWKRMKDK